MGLQNRLRKLEETQHPEPETETGREKERKRIRETAEHINYCRDRGTPPLFEIAESSEVFCAHDGKSVTDWHQTGAEQFCWMEVEWGRPSLIHDEETEAFYILRGFCRFDESV